MKRLSYLASPYSHPDPEVRRQRFEDVCRIAGRLMSQGKLIFSPIAHTHPIAEMGDLPKGFDFWEEFDRAMLAACGELLILRLSGWQESQGIAAEIEIATEMDIPINYIDP